ncbi:helix-turn-helix domain-containing protein [Gordonia sp. PP30]|uniref:helix-turn-helix transcriptional regulator n=1 Tax=Gordonia sp. PP30 TaxID=2935861 RepID=UPI001FFEDDB0|nr:helix-turn-helix domain-containing protein [Gordonia sp. PP30]UQE74698.1 helix-turn-helix domain-containing protein [Gordonia sp. PP30]
MTETDSLLSTLSAAAYIGMTPGTLRAWRKQGTGPAYVKTGDDDRAAVRYRRSDLDRWLDDRTVRPVR